MSRPPRRDSRGGGSGPPRPGRRVPPPDSTGFEARYLDAALDEGLSLRVRMSDGKAVEGTVREHDREILTIDVKDGGPVMIRKAEIRYVEEV